jgi:hypothetical protein
MSGHASAAERIYGLVLRAYPAAFRTAYGREMLMLFRDRRREVADADGGVRFWVEMLWDVARSAPALRLEALRARRDTDIPTEGGTMKTMAILAVLIGAFEAVNSLAEGWAGGVVNHDAYSLTGGTLGAAAGLALLAAGVAMLLRSRRAAALARGVAVACVAVFAIVAVAAPRLSLLATILGVAFPIALLLFLRRGSGKSVPMTA